MDNCNNNCEGNVYNIGMGCCRPVMVFEDASKYYTKTETKALVKEITTTQVKEIFNNLFRISDGILYIIND